MKSPIQSKRSDIILALGPESSGNFSLYTDGNIDTVDNLGDLLNIESFQTYKKTVTKYLEKNNIKPTIIITDLHPLYRTTQFGKELAEKYNAKHEKVQHHLAHIHATLGEYAALDTTLTTYMGIACDGTGFGFDENIWGGEVFLHEKKNSILETTRIGRLENQILLGGDMAIREPARMIISILNNFLSKEEIFEHIQTHYNKNQFELLYNQLQEKFNCQTTSSTGRILDAASVLLGFSSNARESKHAPIARLEQNSTKPYKLQPVLENKDDIFILKTTPLFKYLLKNFDQDKKRLAATVQHYIAEGLFSIIENSNQKNTLPIYAGGGVINNPIISSYLKEKGVYMGENIPRGDPGLSFGQIIYYLANSRN